MSNIELNAKERFSDPTGLFRLPSGSVRIEDPEEEVFLLYTQLSSRRPADASMSSFMGLGSVDSRQDALTVRFTIPAPRPTPRDLEISQLAPNTRVSKVKAKDKRAKSSSHAGQDRVLEIELAQDKTALRSKRGDTGSVLWRVSVALGQAILDGLCLDSSDSLFDVEKLKDCKVLELGAGTGLLSLVFMSWVRHYTATDLDYLVPLIRKNVTTNLSVVQKTIKSAWPDSPLPSKRPKRHLVPRPTNLHGSAKENENLNRVTVECLDWLELQHATPHARRTSFQFKHADPPGLIVIADCVYNPSLLPPLITTIDHFAVPEQTCVLVAVELRSADVVREFLQLWLGLGGWEIWRVGSRHGDADANNVQDGDNIVDVGWLGVDFAVWIGWKRM